MNETEKKALELVNEHSIYKDYNFDAVGTHVAFIALCRAIEQHEAFRQEVSDVAEHLCKFYGVPIVMDKLARFIIAKPDPLVEALQEWWDADGYASIETFRAALAKRGLEIREKGE